MKKESPVVTAILPVWTGEEYISETIESIIAQTFTDWEMLVIGEPDGSDSLKQIAISYARKDNRISWIENESHLGLAESLNKGIELARGKYLARIDVDDPSFPKRFEKQIEYLELNTDIGVLGTQSRNIYPNSTNITRLPVKPENIRASLLFGSYICHPSLMLRRELFIANGWRYPQGWLQEDHALWLSIIDKVTFANLDEPLINHRCGFKNNVSYVNRDLIPDCHHKLIAKALSDHLHIEVDKYPLNRFLNTNEDIINYVKPEDLVFWIVDTIQLQLLMERSNNKYRVFCRNAFARTLRLRWNWMIDGSIINKIYFQIRLLPYLSEKTERSFRDDLLTALKRCGSTFIQDTDDEIIDAVHDSFEGYSANIVKILNSNPDVVFFGTGYYCNNFLSEYHRTDNIYNLKAFCDNDKNKQGRTKLDKPIVAPAELMAMRFDYIVIATRDYYQQIYQQLVDMGIPANKLLPLDVFKSKN